MKELSEKDRLYNAIIKTVKEYGADMEIGLVRAVLAEVEGSICRAMGMQTIETIADRLRERAPRV